jgi:hypothetical protein
MPVQLSNLEARDILEIVEARYKLASSIFIGRKHSMRKKKEIHHAGLPVAPRSTEMIYHPSQPPGNTPHLASPFKGEGRRKGADSPKSCRYYRKSEKHNRKAITKRHQEKFLWWLCH